MFEPRSRSLSRSLAIVTIVSCAACEPPAPRDDTPAIPAAAEPEPDPTPAEPEPEARPATGAQAFLNFEGAGVHLLDDSGMRLVHAPRSSYRDLVRYGDFTYGLSSFGVERIDAGGQTRSFAAIEGPIFAQLGKPARVAGDPRKGKVWVLGDAGIGLWSREWTVTGLNEVGDAGEVDLEIAADLAVGPDGQAWLARGGLWRAQEGASAWVRIPEVAGARAVAVAGTKLVVATGCDAQTDRCTLLVDPGGAARVLALEAGGCHDYERLALSPDAKLAVLAGRCGILRASLGPDAEPSPSPSPRVDRRGGWPGQALTSLALDNRGRAWAGTANGLTLVDADGTVHDYPIGRLVDISGPVNAIVVTGEGPPPPRLGPARATGIKAKAMHEIAGQLVPLTSANIQLCAKPAFNPGAEPGASPCAGAPEVIETQTRATGEFVVTTMPLDHYTIAAEIDGQWRRGEVKAMNLRAEMIGNIGRVRF